MMQLEIPDQLVYAIQQAIKREASRTAEEADKAAIDSGKARLWRRAAELSELAEGMGRR